DLGLAGSATYVLGHGMTKAALFMAVGILLHRFAEVDERELRGRGRERSLRVAAAVFVLGGLVVAGAPLATTFFGKPMTDAAAAIALTADATLRPIPDRLRAGGARALDGLRRLHSGHVGDYVAWLTAGLAALGAVFALSLR